MIKDLLDFDTPNVGYEDMEKQSVCGCCGTYYVVGVGELSEIKETVSALYEALKEAEPYIAELAHVSAPFLNCLDKIRKALAKVGK